MKTVYEAYKEASEDINIQENKRIVIESKDPDYCYWFAIMIPRSNIKAHEEVILKNKNPYDCYRFARDVKDSNKEELLKVVLESGDEYWINRFLERVDFDKEKFADYLLFI